MADEAGEFFRKHWGDVASLAGFTLSLYAWFRIRSAAEAATKATIEIRKRRPPDPEENELNPITAEWRRDADLALIPAG